MGTLTQFERRIVVPHSQPITPAHHVRSTLLQSSLGSLRNLGRFEQYAQVVAPEYRSLIIESLAPIWLPIEVGVAHYRACEALQLTNAEQLKMGETVGDRMQGTFLATLLKTARAAGFDPMVLLMQFDRLWARAFQGSSAQVSKTGPKDVEIEFSGVRLTAISYFRTALAGVIRGGVRFAGVRSSHAKLGRYVAATDTLTVYVSWV